MNPPAPDPVALVHRLFHAWSSGNPDSLQPLFHPDATFCDSVNGTFTGWPAIRAFYASSLNTWSRLECTATRIWTDGETAACTWTMLGEIADDRFGPGTAGATCRIDGMAYMIFDGELIIHDEEYFDRDATRRSLSGEREGDSGPTTSDSSPTDDLPSAE
jgi:ketosteroid isomerase-like protein